MTSIIKVDEIQNKAGTTTLDADKLPTAYSGSAKAFAEVNTAGDTILGTSLNVSSVTDVTTGQRKLNLANAMSTLESPSCGGNAAGNIGAVYTNFFDTSTLNLYFYSSSHAAADYAGAAFGFGDLA
jgi:hypothetical protein